MLHCRTVEDVVAAIKSGDRVIPRGGGHCFVDRRSPGDVLLDLTGLNTIEVRADGVATIGAGALLGQVYDALHAAGRGLPAGCGETVGIAGLTLGGGIGLIGRRYGLTCDRLLGAQVVLADGTVVDCDASCEPDLFWALRGAGGGQFGVVTSLRFDTVPEPITTRISATWVPRDPEVLVAVWQAWAPDAPDDLTLNLTIDGPRAILVGASLLPVEPTQALLAEFADLVGTPVPFELRAGMPLSAVKASFGEAMPDERPRIRSEFFEQSLSDDVLGALIGGGRLAFTAMGGAYNRIAADATAFAHRNQRFLLETANERSWSIAHADGSGRVYPNFPDLSLTDGPAAYHGENLGRLRAVKQAYDPDRFFNFPQAV
ncbi:FAD-binding oxidoreductase [Kribbella albertanoniae]|uniref:FAD-binding oxidoreductase n=1 Tax=Kribbella albertanoniae TaxID=1266829 RepID=A0A4R4PQF8_9ACTN|nr:FAD-binding oxidoreductase [Kribbella albertanoniae]TDC24456.1 FAD-binding oxidoreductase [Kribbella albertanoniae]